MERIKKDSHLTKIFNSIPPEHRLMGFLLIIIQAIFIYIINSSGDETEWENMIIPLSIIIVVTVITISLVNKFFSGNKNKTNITEVKSINYNNAKIGNPNIAVKCDVNKGDNIRIYAELYKRDNNMEEWTYDRVIELAYDNHGEFKIQTNQIKSLLNTPDSPYKLYCKVPKKVDILKEYYYKLLTNSNTIITGKGTKDLEKDFWRIYFLVNDQPPHSDMKGLYEINHSIRQ